MSGRVKVMETALLSLSHGGSSRSGQSSDVCRLFNDKHCNSWNCKYRHACDGAAGHIQAVNVGQEAGQSRVRVPFGMITPGGGGGGGGKQRPILGGQTGWWHAMNRNCSGV